MWIWLLATGLTACGEHLDLSPDVVLTHQHEAAFRQQVRLLGAGTVRLSAQPARTSPAGLELEVRDVRNASQQPDTLRQRVRKLVHLLAVDVAQPERYGAVSVLVQEHTGLLEKEAAPQFFIYPLAALR